MRIGQKNWEFPGIFSRSHIYYECQRARNSDQILLLGFEIKNIDVIRGGGEDLILGENVNLVPPRENK